ncbi:hypothetical protein DFH94DRAFT_777431, partial [Russula ochroleuca]
TIAPFGDAYEKIGTIQRRLAWPLHKDDTLFQSGRPTVTERRKPGSLGAILRSLTTFSASQTD